MKKNTISKNRKKKVLFTSHTANFSKFNRPFMRLLKQHGYEVHYASMGEEDVLDCDRHFTVPFRRSPYDLKNVRAYRELKAIINREDYTLIHTHTPVGSIVTRLASYAARKRGTKVMYTAHGFHFFTGAPLKNWLLYYSAERLLARWADVLVTINEEDFLRAKQKMPVKQLYLLNGIGFDSERFKPVSNSVKHQLRTKHGYHDCDYLLVYAAELNSNKNQEFLIRAMPTLLEQVPQAKLILCGTGYSKALYRKLIEDSKITDKVQMTGYRDDVHEFFQMADICVASSIREGFGINIVEAMAVGLPVVASMNRGHKSVVTEKNGVLFDLKKQRDYIDAVDDYSKNRQLAGDTRKHNIEDAKKYSSAHAVKKMSEIYKVTLNDKAWHID